jgi:hypothetical protein
MPVSLTKYLMFVPIFFSLKLLPNFFLKKDKVEGTLSYKERGKHIKGPYLLQQISVSFVNAFLHLSYFGTSSYKNPAHSHVQRKYY